MSHTPPATFVATQELNADLDTPVTAYLKASQQESVSFLLESVEAGEKLGRYSFIGVGEQGKFQYRDGQVQRTGVFEEFSGPEGDPLASLFHATRRPVTLPAGLPAFIGGAVGYAAYDIIRAYETLPDGNPDELNVPDALFIAPRGMVIFDHLKHRLIAVATAPTQAQADQEVSGLIRKLRGPLPGVPGRDPAPAPHFTSNHTPGAYMDVVRRGKAYIEAGDIFQFVPSQRFSADLTVHPFALYRALRRVNPSPYLGYLHLQASSGEPVILVASSPESLLRSDGHSVTTRPIAGTRRRGDTPAEDAALEAELRASTKEVAEHTMLVDLVRHDLGRVAQPGSVHVPDLMLVERYSHVMHLVSQVEARARPGVTLRDVLAATFPGGTITGAPKERVMQAIRDLEPGPRGWYTGGVGIVSGARVDLNILIRTAAFTRTGSEGTPGDWTVEVRAGGGTVIDADPLREAQETVHKAQALLSVLSGVPGRPAKPPASPRPGQPWSPPPPVSAPGLRVLLLDNRDSFTWNLVHDLQALGAAVDVRSQDEEAAGLLGTGPDAVLIGPGPGTPDTGGCTLALTRLCLERRVPLLGVCLGHQALGQVLGGRVERADPVHGRPETVTHGGTDLFAGVTHGAAFGRYHSLVVRGLPEDLVTARSAGGEVMALRAPGAPAWGVQFHPESVLSPAGRVLLGNWLRLAARTCTQA